MEKKVPNSLFGCAIRFVVPLGIAGLLAFWLVGSHIIRTYVDSGLSENFRETGEVEIARTRDRLDDIVGSATALAENELLVDKFADTDGKAGSLPSLFHSLRLSASKLARISPATSYPIARERCCSVP